MPQPGRHLRFRDQAQDPVEEIEGNHDWRKAKDEFGVYYWQPSSVFQHSKTRPYKPSPKPHNPYVDEGISRPDEMNAAGKVLRWVGVTVASGLVAHLVWGWIDWGED